MMKKTFLALVAVGGLSAGPATAKDFAVEITNLTNAIYFTPLLVSAHPGTTHVFAEGLSASANLQAMAEGGDISGLSSDLAAVGANVVENPAIGLLAPGASATASFTYDSSNPDLSVVGMLLPTNDGFVGLNSLEIPKKPGAYVYYLNGYDAGTEANNEVINGGGAPGTLGIPADPGGHNGTGGTGFAAADANTTVHIHRGVLGDTDNTGGASDLDSRVHRWLNPVAKLVITVN